MSHIHVETLVDYVRGLGAPSDRARMAEHLTVCDACATRASQLAHLADTARADSRQGIDQRALDAAHGIFSAGPLLRHRGSEVARQIVDSRPPSAGRTDEHGHDERRRLLFHASAVGIDLRVINGGDRVELEGVIVDRATGLPLKADVRAERHWDSPAIARAFSDRSFALSYPSPVSVVLRLVVDGVQPAIAVPLDTPLPACEGA